ncbi:glycosyltransferase family 61 protein [Paenibacillus glycanilyticus]|uniref:glycosyltransferase family 61 protein n=1 Tax=Paenibacillus glycanilyticus TaxID=126569 RepID=UPI00203E2440|nr:glycosyltransferase family 61 protein [Paenibacillus glycanilyticus]MCM3626017.1 glycosyltransferase family 61 protein [Paenibacillus glycanilyticus]
MKHTIPKDIYKKTKEWVKTLPASEADDRYQVIYPAETIQLPAPLSVDPHRWVSTCSYDEAFVVSIPEGRLMTSHMYVITPDNKRLADLELYDARYEAMNLDEPDYYPGTVAPLFWGWNITNPYSHGTHTVFGHWFFDLMPRIHLLEKSGIPIDKFVLPKLTLAFQFESLKLLGVPLDKVIQVDKPDFHLKAKKLVVSAVPLVIGKCPPWASHYITDQMKNKRKIRKRKGYERIYITREDALARHVANEAEVLQYLQTKGFKKIVLTPMSTEEKIDVFASARIIVAPFGSGSINVAFCEPGASLIELAPVSFVDNYFWKLCCHAGLDYYEMLCQVEPKAHVGADNIIVDIGKLDHYLRLNGIVNA